MKTLLVLLLVVALLLVSGAALAQAGGPGPVPAYVVQAGTTAGGSYQLTSLSWRVSGAVSGGAYRLAGAGPWGQCCCTYLPITLRNR